MAIGGMPVQVTTSDVISFRLRAHHLTGRRPADELVEVTGACAVQNSPPGSALLAIHARVENLSQDRFEREVGDAKTLLQTWCMRGAPFYFPTADAPVFTTGVLPSTESARLHLIVGIEQALTTLELGLDEAVDLVAAVIGTVLAGRQLAIHELGAEIAVRIAPTLSPVQRRAWQESGPYGTKVPLGEAVVHFCIRILTLRGIVCFGPRKQNKAPFVLLEEWLGRPLPPVDPVRARTALLRRYLHSYGPSTRKDFAAWVGVQAAEVDPWWTPLEDEIISVDVDGRPASILAGDLEDLRSPSETHGLRLLPPRDPYTQLRDRETIVAKKFHREVWKTVGEPGVILADGEVVGIWRPRKRGRTLTLTTRTFQPLNIRLRDQLRDEAELVAQLRGASSVEVEFENWVS